MPSPERQSLTDLGPFWRGYSLPMMLEDCVERGEVSLVVAPRSDVEGGRWYTLHWISADGKRYEVSARTLTTALRSAEGIERQGRIDALGRRRSAL